MDFKPGKEPLGVTLERRWVGGGRGEWRTEVVEKFAARDR